MTPFLLGFAGELIKVGQFQPSLAPPPAPGSGASTGGPPTTFKPPGGGRLAIPTQKMESPAAAPRPQRFRPSPGFSPKPSSDPTPAVKKPGGSRKTRPRKDIVPWETAGQRWGRLSKEKAHNIGRRKQEQRAVQKKQKAPVGRKKPAAGAPSKSSPGIGFSVKRPARTPPVQSRSVIMGPAKQQPPQKRVNAVSGAAARISAQRLKLPTAGG